MSDFEYFASGTNEQGQIWGFARIGHPLGVAADECLGRTGCEEALIEIARVYPAQRVFIDSAAFSEVSPDPKVQAKHGLEPRPGELLVVKPISDAEWRERLAFMQRIADAYGSRALIIAPDLVGNQEVTLERLDRYREEVLAIARAGAEVGVVLHRGPPMQQTEFEDEVTRLLGWDGFVRAFPMKKGATRPEQLRAYLEQRQPHRMHLLGVGPRSKGNKKEGRASAKQILEIFAELGPDLDVSWDSCLIAASVARDVPGGRPLTRAQDVQAQELRAEAFQSSGTVDPFRGIEYDWTEAEPYDYLGPGWGAETVRAARAALAAQDSAAARRRLKAAEKAYLARAHETARRAGLTAEEAERFVRDPNAFVHEVDDSGVERWEWDLNLAGELEESFSAWAIESSAQLRKERSVVVAFGPGERGPQEGTFLAPVIHPKSGRVVRGEVREVPAAGDPGETLHEHRRPEAGQQLKLTLNARRRELKRKLMR